MTPMTKKRGKDKAELSDEDDDDGDVTLIDTVTTADIEWQKDKETKQRIELEERLLAECPETSALISQRIRSLLSGTSSHRRDSSTPNPSNTARPTSTHPSPTPAPPTPGTASRCATQVRFAENHERPRRPSDAS